MMVFANSDATCTIEATVVSGFETVAASEIEEKLGVKPKPLYDDYDTFKGHLYFSLRESAVPQLAQLQTVDNLYVVVSTPEISLQFPEDDNYSCLQLLRRLPAKIDWSKALRVWRRMFPGRFVHYEVAVMTEEEMLEFYAAEPEHEWCPNVSWINPRLEKADGKSKKKKKRKVESGTEKDEQTDENGESCKKETEADGDYSEAGPSADEVNITKDVSEEALKDNVEKSTSKLTAKRPSEVKVKNCAVPTFRVTCHRGHPSGEKHSFTSQDAAKVFGGAIQSIFQWNVDMTEFDMEVVLNISADRVWATVALTQESLHRRHIQHFGPTTLRPTIAMNLLKFSGLKDGETFCDPMCGGGGIPIEAAYEWPNCLVLAGDNHELAYQRTVDNVQYNNEKIRFKSEAPGNYLSTSDGASQLASDGASQLTSGDTSQSASGDASQSVSIDGTQSSSSLVSPSSLSRPPLSISVFRWDVTLLPLRPESVDVFVTDLPFGKRSGSKVENRVLYPKILNEMARVARRETGRAVLLTEDKNDFFKAMEANQSLWWKKKHLWINIGGMWAGVFLLLRNERPWKPMAQSKNSLKQSAKKKRKMDAAAAAAKSATAEETVAVTACDNDKIDQNADTV